MTLKLIKAFVPIVINGKIVAEMPFDLSELCYQCKNWTDNLNCKAFPDKIPPEILYGQFDHRKPWPNIENPGDHGIRFEPITEGE